MITNWKAAGNGILHPMRDIAFDTMRKTLQDASTQTPGIRGSVAVGSVI